MSGDHADSSIHSWSVWWIAFATGKLFANKPARRAEIEKIAAYNTALSNYVLLLNRLRETLAALVTAVREPNSSQALNSLAAASADLMTDAQAVSRAYAIFRNDH